MRLLRIFGLVAIAISIEFTTVSSPAHAQDAVLQQAKQHFDDAQNLFIQGKFAEAGAKFLEAYNLKNYPAFLFNVAVCYEKAHDFAKALEYYEQYLKVDPNTQDKDTIVKRIESIRVHLNPPTGTTEGKPGEAKPPTEAPDLPPINTKGLVVIESIPEGAAIYLDEKTTGIFTRTPYTGSLPPGQHTIILELKEYRPVRKTFIVRHDRLTYLFFSMTQQQNLGWIEVKANIPNAEVYFDSKDVGAVGRTPYSGHLRPGKRKVIVERSGYEPYVEELEVVAGKTHVIEAKLSTVMYGWLKVTGKTTKGATVKVDGQPVECAEYPCSTRVKIGPHKVEISRDGFKSYSTDFEVAQAEEAQLKVLLTPKPSRIHAYVSLGVAAALLGGGITVGVMSNSKKSQLNDEKDNNLLYDSGDGRFTQGKILAIAANVAFGLSAIVGGLGVYYLFRNEGADPTGEIVKNKVAFTPAIGPQLIGLNSEVRF